MRINLLLQSNDVRSGYKNICPFAQEGDGKIQGNVFNLDDFVDAAECVELLALGVIDYVSLPAVATVLSHWLSKIRRGGSIAIGGINLPSVTKAFYRKDIDLLTMNMVLFGQQAKPVDLKKCALDITWVESTLKAEGFKILQSRIENLHYFVKAERL